MEGLVLVFVSVCFEKGRKSFTLVLLHNCFAKNNYFSRCKGIFIERRKHFREYCSFSSGVIFSFPATLANIEGKMALTSCFDKVGLQNNMKPFMLG